MTGIMEEKGPLFGEAECYQCKFKWQIFLPEGCENRCALECPSCHLMAGRLKPIKKD